LNLTASADRGALQLRLLTSNEDIKDKSYLILIVAISMLYFAIILEKVSLALFKVAEVKMWQFGSEVLISFNQ
jgi:hypothetical protein